MNKAFVKEDDAGLDTTPEIKPDARADIPTGAKNYMTPIGARLLKDELDGLLHEERPRLLECINRINDGNTKHSTDAVNEAKKLLRKIDNRIDFLIQRLELTEIVDPMEVRSERIRFGAMVSIQHEDGTIKEYQIVGIDEADLSKGRVSWTAPLARALLDRTAGDVFSFKTPAGEEEVEICEVRYLNIE